MATDNIKYPDTQGLFRFWTQRVLPAVYGDELSYYEVLCRVAGILNTTIENQDQDNENLKELVEALEKLQKEFEEFKSGGFEDYYAEQYGEWMQDNMWCLLSWNSRIVWFGLSDDGYFTAMIPDNMNFLDFDVVTDPESPDYGKLLLSYCQEVYEPCEISCWDGDCEKPDLSMLAKEE